MTALPANGDDQPDVDADRQDAMKDQLRKDVASWAASRSGETTDLAKPAATASRQTSAPPAPRATRQKPKPAEAAAPAVTEKKPFKMSYDGTTDRDYIAQRIKLGAR